MRSVGESDDAADRLAAERRAAVEVTRAALAQRQVCDDSCPGWFVNGETQRVEACDACRWSPDGPRYHDEDVQLLPEARAARVQTMCQPTTRGRQIYDTSGQTVWVATLRVMMTHLVDLANHKALCERAPLPSRCVRWP